MSESEAWAEAIQGVRALFPKAGRLPRAVVTADKLIQRKRDGRVFMVHHQGYAAGFAALFSDRPHFWFVPLRQLHGRWVAAIDYGWAPESGSEFRVFHQTYGVEITCVGRKAAARICDGGLRGSYA